MPNNFPHLIHWRWQEIRIKAFFIKIFFFWQIKKTYHQCTDGMWLNEWNKMIATLLSQSEKLSNLFLKMFMNFFLSYLKVLHLDIWDSVCFYWQSQSFTLKIFHDLNDWKISPMLFFALNCNCNMAQLTVWKFQHVLRKSYWSFKMICGLKNQCQVYVVLIQNSS